MPPLEWNRKWGRMLAEFEESAQEPHWGDRWGDPETCEPYVEVRRRFVEPYLRPGLDVVEIGSGGGRWTQYLLPSARRLVVVELNPESFDHLRRRFPAYLDRLEFQRTNGYEISSVSGASIDLVFTLDVFVHLEPDGIGNYLAEIERVLRPGAAPSRITATSASPSPPRIRASRTAQMESLLGTTRLGVLDHDDKVMCHSNIVVLEK